MKLNVLVDISGIFYRTLFTVGNYGTDSTEKLLQTKKSQGVFVRKLATDLTSFLKNLDCNCRTIICVDSNSWRKSITIEDGDYKSNRKKDDSKVDWKAFHDLTEKFIEILGTKGYVISKIPGAEADDLLYLWSKKLNDLEENCIIITGDRDLLQVITHNENDSWTVCIDPVNNRKKISYVQETFNSSFKTIKKASIFDSDNWIDSTDILTRLFEIFEKNIVDVNKIMSKKILLGDGGDSVPSVITWKNEKKPDKFCNITESNFNKILEKCPNLESSHWKEVISDKFVNDIISVMEPLKKIKVNSEKLQENLERNALLVVLSHDTIPLEIIQAFNQEYEIIPEVLPLVNRDSILGGTEWWTSDKNGIVPKSYDLFS